MQWKKKSNFTSWCLNISYLSILRVCRWTCSFNYCWSFLKQNNIIIFFYSSCSLCNDFLLSWMLVPNGISYLCPVYFLPVVTTLFFFRKMFFLISCSFGGTDNPGTLAWSEKVYQLSFYRSWCSYWTFWAQVVLTFLQNCKLFHVLPLNDFLYQIKFCFLQIKNAKGNKYFLIKKKKICQSILTSNWQPHILTELFIPWTLFYLL